MHCRRFVAGEMGATSRNIADRQGSTDAGEAVLGLFSSRRLGIGVVGLVGGWLFDHWSPVGPFIYMAASNVVMFALALVIYSVTRVRTVPVTLKG
jgi:hypothetical protein